MNREKEIEMILESLVFTLRDELNDRLLGAPVMKQCERVISEAAKISCYVKEMKELKAK